MTTIIKARGLAIFFDGDSSPTIVQDAADPWRPERRDMSWRIEDETTGRVVDEYHPPKPRHTNRLVLYVALRSVYGIDKFYPINDTAKALASIAGTSTLTPEVLRQAKSRLGATVLVAENNAAKAAALLA